MSWLRTLMSRIAGQFGGSRQESELDEELRFHLEMETEDNIRKGMSPREARRQAQMRLGGTEQVKEEYRERRGLPFLESFFQDLRFAMRSFRRDLGFTSTVLVTLALGIGVGTAIFAVVNAILLQPLPYKEPDRLVYLKWTRTGEDASAGVNVTSYRQAQSFYDWRDRSGVFESLSVGNPGVILFDNETQAALRVDENLSDTLGVQPLHGRWFLREERPLSVLPRKVVLQYEFWKSRYGGDPGVVGRTFTIGTVGYRPEPTTIVGVMPPGFAFRGRSTQMFAPLTLRSTGNAFSFLIAVGRIKSGLTLEQAQSRVEEFSRQLSEQDPDTHAGWRYSLTPVSEEAAAGLLGPLRLLLAASGLVLLIVCLNIAGLLLMRSQSRSSELAVRSAIGAGRRRLVRQLTTENTAIWALGGLFGLSLAYLLVDYLRSWIPGTTWADGVLAVDRIQIDSWVILFAGAAALASGLLFGLVPALRGASIRLAPQINEGSGRAIGSHRARQWLGGAQISLAVILTIGACLLLRSFLIVQQKGAGFKSEEILWLSVRGLGGGPGDQAAPDEWRQYYRTFWEQVKEELQSVPGVTGVTYGATPMAEYWTEPYLPENPNEPTRDPIDLAVVAVDADYFRVLGIPLIEGRNADAKGGGYVINEEAARRLWPGESPVGKNILYAGPILHILFGAKAKQRAEVIGVVGDVQGGGLRTAPQPTIYWVGELYSAGELFLKTTREPNAFLPEVLERIRGLNPDVFTGVQEYDRMDRVVRDSDWQLNFSMLLLTGLAGLAVLISAVGVYGSLSYMVRQQTREIGVRMALGAEPSQVEGVVLRRGLAVAVPGVVVGILGATALTRLLGNLLFGVEPLDAPTFAGVALVLLAVAMLASYIPARRAASVDPLVALRHQ